MPSHGLGICYDYSAWGNFDEVAHEQSGYGREVFADLKDDIKGLYEKMRRDLATAGSAGPSAADLFQTLSLP